MCGSVPLKTQETSTDEGKKLRISCNNDFFLKIYNFFTGNQPRRRSSTRLRAQFDRRLSDVSN